METLINLLPIMLGGGRAYAAVGTEQSTGPKLFCLSGAVAKPGVYEVEFGATMRELLALAGGTTGGAPRAILLGGAAGQLPSAPSTSICRSPSRTLAPPAPRSAPAW